MAVPLRALLTAVKKALWKWNIPGEHVTVDRSIEGRLRLVIDLPAADVLDDEPRSRATPQSMGRSAWATPERGKK